MVFYSFEKSIELKIVEANFKFSQFYFGQKSKLCRKTFNNGKDDLLLFKAKYIS